MKSVPHLLDAIKKQHAISSDYKLSLYLDLREQTIANYRHGRTLPDASGCAKIAAALGIDADLLTVEIEAQRAKTDDARRLWERVAQRLQMGFASCKLLALIAMFSIAGAALPAWAAVGFISFSVEQSVYYVKRRLDRSYYRLALLLGQFVKLCKAGPDVPRHPHPAAVRPA